MYAGLTTAGKSALLAAKNADLAICFLWSIGKAVNVDEALAQIAEMESAEKPDGCEYCATNGTIWSRFTSVCYRQDGEKRFDERDVNVKFCPNCGRNLDSPDTEGETK